MYFNPMVFWVSASGQGASQIARQVTAQHQTKSQPIVVQLKVSAFKITFRFIYRECFFVFSFSNEKLHYII